tara:strand:+ start:536 stop:649 length:114 start_codon:yes stop_codon:yes gene_type:complete
MWDIFITSTEKKNVKKNGTIRGTRTPISQFRRLVPYP